MVKPVLALLLLFQAGNFSARLDVRARGESVSVEARAVPLWQILDRLAQQTGMKVTYEGPKPAALVTTAFETSSHTELLIRLMEGQGLNYAFQTDATGKQVQRLLVGEPIAAPGAAAASHERRPASSPPVAQAPNWNEITDDDANSFNNAEADALPMMPTVPSFPFGQGPNGAPGQGPNGAPFVLPGGITIPTFPGAASHPIVPQSNPIPPPMPSPIPLVSPPTFPEGASEPVHR